MSTRAQRRSQEDAEPACICSRQRTRERGWQLPCLLHNCTPLNMHTIAHNCKSTHTHINNCMPLHMHKTAHKSTNTHTSIGLARTIYIRCTYGIFGLEITKYTVYIYVYIRFWPTLHINNCMPLHMHKST